MLRDPVTNAPFPGNVIPQNRITTDGRAMANIYRSMQGKAASVHRHADRQQHDVCQEYNPFESRQDIIRIDWQANRRNSASTDATSTTSTT